MTRQRTDARNVLGEPLRDCSHDPITGWFRDGCCDTDGRDAGMHVVCARVNAAFLAHQKRIGNDLSTPRPEFNFPGLRPGDQWCVCLPRWKQALDDGAACPIVLEATHEEALAVLPIEVLRRYAVDVS